MTAAKIAISIDQGILKRVDSLVRAKRFRSRSELFQAAISEQLGRLEEDAFSRECLKLDPQEEQAFAEVGLSTDLSEWAAY
jgi:Arc/MetJ-type ribon-helix-helix transcriptional regulator